MENKITRREGDALAHLSHVQSARGPITTVAARLGVSVQRTKTLVDALEAKGLVARRGHRVAVLATEVHRHAEGESCFESTRGQPPSGCFFASPEGAVDVIAFSMIAKSVREVARVVFEADKRRKKPRSRAPEGDDEPCALALAYRGRRRRPQPEYELTRRASNELAKTQAFIESQGVKPDTFRAYVEHVADAFARMSGGGTFPPYSLLKSETFVATFLAARPKKVIDSKSLRRFLRERGFSGSVDQVLANFARVNEGRALPPDVPKEVVEAVALVVEHAREIGFVESKP